MPDKEVGKDQGLVNLVALHWEVPPSEEVKVLQFEDTLSEMHCRNFNLIYESLLLEGKAGNLTDLTLGMVLVQKPLPWLQVVHGWLIHLIISSETFQKKKKAEYNAQANAKQTGKENGMGKHSKGIRYLGVSGKGKGKGPIEKYQDKDSTSQL